MKKITLTLLPILLVLILAACGSEETKTVPNAGEDTTRQGNFEPPVEMQLMMGIVKLEDTENAIDLEQAADLLPLWKALRSLADSETTAQVEIDAVITQIEDTMTTEQMEAIEAMDLTMQDFGSVAEILGIEGGFSGRFGEMTSEMQATMEAMRESGEFPGNRPGFGDGPGFGGGQGPGGGFGGQEGFTPEMRETAMAERGITRGAGFGINSTLLDGFITFLEAKVQ